MSYWRSWPSLYSIWRTPARQLDLFSEVDKTAWLAGMMDTINARRDEFVLTPARMLGMADMMPDHIIFGSVKELKERVLR